MGNCCDGRERTTESVPHVPNGITQDENLKILAKQDLKPAYTKEQREQHAPNDPAITLLKEIPSDIISNLKSPCYPLENFKFDKDDPELKELPILGPYHMEKGSIYLGQFKHGKRHGRGRQIWTDGSYYEGYWKDDMANGHGRLVRQ